MKLQVLKKRGKRVEEGVDKRYTVSYPFEFALDLDGDVINLGKLDN